MEDILNIAKSYIDKLNREEPFHSDYKYSINSSPIEYRNQWYFDFVIISNKSISSKEILSFAGAPGFLISKIDKTIKMISLGELYELDEEKIRFQELDKLLLEFKDKNWNSSKIKLITKLKPIEIIKVKNKFKNIDLADEQNRLIIISHLNKLINTNN